MAARPTGKRAAHRAMTNVHATCVALGDRGALLLGPSGSGKSDLALRFVALPPTPGLGVTLQPALVADDRVTLRREAARLMATPPANLAGLLEVHGVGILRVPHVAAAPVRLVVELVAAAEVERHPVPLAMVGLLGLELPHARLAPFAASAPLKLALLLAGLDDGAAETLEPTAE